MGFLLGILFSYVMMMVFFFVYAYRDVRKGIMPPIAKDEWPLLIKDIALWPVTLWKDH